MKTENKEYYVQFESEDYRGKFTMQIQNDCSQIRFENEDDSVAFDCDKKELKAMRDMIDSSISKVISEADEVKEVEQKTVRTLETLGAFADWVKENHEIELDSLIVEYLES